MATEQYTADLAWVKLHVDLYVSGCARPQGRRAMAAAYRRFATHHPALAQLAHEQAELCEVEGSHEEEVAYAPAD